MKNLLFALIVLCSVNLNGQNKIWNTTQWNLDSFTNKSLLCLGNDSMTVFIRPVSGLIFDRYFAAMHKESAVYFIDISKQIDNYDDVLKAVAHEIVHIDQIAKNKLVIINGENIVFNGVNYTVNERTHYLDKHELEAKKLSKELEKKNKIVVFIPKRIEKIKYNNMD